MQTVDLGNRKISASLTKPPSYVDHIMRFLQSLPAPYWLTCLLLVVLQGTINHAAAWIEGWLPLFAFNSVLLTFPIWQWVPLAIMVFLNKTSRVALDSFRPLLDLDDDAFTGLEREMTTMPPRAVIFTSLFWVAGYVAARLLNPGVIAQMGTGPVTLWLLDIQGIFCFGIGGVMYYHTLRQLALIDRIVKIARPFNLFALDPVYAFSRLTSRTGLSWILMLGLNFLAFPLNLAPGLVLLYAVLILVLAVLGFSLPLRVVNQRLVAQKRLLLAEHQNRVEKSLARLHTSLDQAELTYMEQHNEALDSLAAERKVLEDIPTWPWRPATLRGFVSAAVLPIVLMLVQIIIERFVR